MSGKGTSVEPEDIVGDESFQKRAAFACQYFEDAYEVIAAHPDGQTVNTLLSGMAAALAKLTLAHRPDDAEVDNVAVNTLMMITHYFAMFRIQEEQKKAMN